MMFSKTKVEEDLEKIRRANLPYDIIIQDTNKNDELKLEKGDLLAMILAVMSLVLPYVGAFISIMVAVIFLLVSFYS